MPSPLCLKCPEFLISLRISCRTCSAQSTKKLPVGYRQLWAFNECYFALMTIVAELFAGFVSVPLNVAEPVNASEPAAATVKFKVTCIV